MNSTKNFLSQQTVPEQQNLPFRILIHGGAWAIPDPLKLPHKKGVTQAYELAKNLLLKNIDPLKVIVEVLTLLEDDPTFDAGYGSFLTENSEVELDASIMSGSTLQAGCIASVRTVKNPSKLALALHNDPNTVFLSGLGAEKFAQNLGFEEVSNKQLVLPREIENHQKWLENGKPDAKVYFSKPHPKGTVGVVIGKRAPNGTFNLFSGLSTGGTPAKIQSRIGDTPVIGSGILADDESVAVACTGWGEGLLRISAASQVKCYFESGLSVQKATDKTLQYLYRRTEGKGGIIAIDKYGNLGASFSTPDMAYCGTINPTQLHLEHIH